MSERIKPITKLQKIAALESLHNWQERDLRAAIAALQTENESLRRALEDMTRRYVDLAGSGDCGFWDPEAEEEVIAARAALEESK